MHSLNLVVLALAAVAAASPAIDLFGRTSCSTPDGDGTCVDTSSCSGFHVAGYCPGASNIQCCISKSCSTPSGSGTCKNNDDSCSGSYVAGYCPGDSSIECCVPSSGSGGSCSTPDGSGTCKDTSSCGGFSVAGYCPGASNIQCCISASCSTPSGSGTCKNTDDSCSGSFIAGYCPGDSSVECCVAGSSSGSGGSCSTPDGDGTCKDTSSCSGFSVAGYCPGASNIQCCISESCSTPQGSGSCKNTANGCSGGAFVAGYCPGDSSIECCVAGASGGGGGGGGSGDSSTINGAITRAEIITRAMYWINNHVPYSMDATYPDLEGTDYRTDCSGFVSMALHTSPPGYSTVSLPDVAVSISWSDLQQGDFVGTLGPGTGGAAGHVTLFHSWANSGHTVYNSLECQGGNGCIATTEDVGWTDSGYTAEPYRYTRVES